MRHKGTTLEYTKQRDLELLAAFRSCFYGCNYIRLRDIAAKAVKQRASRFWVTDERAASVILAIKRGEPVLEGMRAPKRQMYEEILRRYDTAMCARPDADPLDVVTEIVYSGAPEFYISASRALHILFKNKGRFYG